jgi:hypothetical protein
MRHGELIPINVKSRITINAAFFHQNNPGYKKPSIDKPKQSDYFFFFKTAEQPGKVEIKGLDPAELDEEGMLICSPTVLGFSYADKMWCRYTSTFRKTNTLTTCVVEFAIIGIEDIQWNTSTLDDLVLPEVQKDMVLALAET